MNNSRNTPSGTRTQYSYRVQQQNQNGQTVGQGYVRNVGTQQHYAPNQQPLRNVGTPNYRPPQKRAVTEKITLTPEQMEINRVNREREKYYHKKQRGRFFKTLLIRFFVFLVVFAVMAGMVTAALFYQLTKQDPVDVSGYSYKIGDGNTYTLKYADAIHEGHIYISFTDIANLCGMAMVGSTEDIKYVMIGDETETIRFLTNTRVVYVNGVETRLPSSSYYKNEKLYVPVDFVDSYCKGLTVDVNTSTHRVTVQRILLNANEKGVVPKGEIAEYDTLSFLLASPSPMTGITEETAKAFIKTPDMGFLENLSSYEEYMNPGNTTEYLTLVNVNHLLDSSYVPQDMLTVSATRDDGRALQQLRTYAAKSLEAMFREMRANGIEDVSVTSAYRSYSYQKALFDERLVQFSSLGTEGAYKAASEIVNPPGGSEHQTGLCCDMHNLASADVAFSKEDAYKWISENCWKFGFILRYPEDKVNITGISFEPWHYRYVGRYHAQKMKELGMCLEEYWAYLGYN